MCHPSLSEQPDSGGTAIQTTVEEKSNRYLEHNITMEGDKEMKGTWGEVVFTHQL